MRGQARSKHVWQAVIVAEAAVMGLGLWLAINHDTTTINVASLLEALLGRIDVKSEAWLWVARIAAGLLVITAVQYKRGPAARDGR